MSRAPTVHDTPFWSEVRGSDLPVGPDPGCQAAGQGRAAQGGSLPPHLWFRGCSRGQQEQPPSSSARQGQRRTSSRRVNNLERSVERPGRCSKKQLGAQRRGHDGASASREGGGPLAPDYTPAGMPHWLQDPWDTSLTAATPRKTIGP